MPTLDTVQLISDQSAPTYQQILVSMLQQSKLILDSRCSEYAKKAVLQSIKTHASYREDKTFTMFAAPPLDFFTTQWNFVSKRLPVYPYNTESIIAQLVSRRVNKVVRDLRQQKLVIEQQKAIENYNFEMDEKNGKVAALKNQSEDIKRKINEINNSLQNDVAEQEGLETSKSGNKNLFSHLYTEQKKKEVEAFIKKKHQQKQQRRKKIEAQKLKEEEEFQQKQKERKENEEKEEKIRKEENIKRQVQLHDRRKKEKIQRQQKSKQYEQFLKKQSDKPKLFQLLQENFTKKVEYEEMEKRHKMISERKARYFKVDEIKIDEHIKSYEQDKKLKAEERQKRIEEFLEQQKNNYNRYHSSYQFERPTDAKIQQKQRAKQKAQKIKYYESVVRENYKPKVDEQKKREMATMIQQLQLNSHKKMKKKVLENGSIIYEQVRQIDPRILGIMYLQKTKQIAAQAKNNKKRSSSIQLAPTKVNKPIDYLQQLKNNPKRKVIRKLSFSDKSNLSFDQKVNKIMVESEKLNEAVKHNEMKLKFGKFMTSDQILNCKQQIDEKYIEITKLKLKLIKQ